MPALKNVEELTHLRETLKVNLEAGKVEMPIITIGMGTCGQAAGAGDTYRAVEREIEKRSLVASVRSVGCIGLCMMEPLVDIQLVGQPRVTYANVRPSQIPRIIEEHVINGKIVQEWAIGFIPPEW